MGSTFRGLTSQPPLEQSKQPQYDEDHEDRADDGEERVHLPSLSPSPATTTLGFTTTRRALPSSAIPASLRDLNVTPILIFQDQYPTRVGGRHEPFFTRARTESALRAVGLLVRAVAPDMRPSLRPQRRCAGGISMKRAT